MPCWAEEVAARRTPATMQPVTLEQLQALFNQVVVDYNQHRPHRSLPHRATPCGSVPHPQRSRGWPGSFKKMDLFSVVDDFRPCRADRDRPSRAHALADHMVCELRAGGDSELPEHLAQVVLDGAGAHEQLGSDLPIPFPAAHQGSYLGFPWSELLRVTDDLFTDAITCGAQLHAGSLGEGVETRGLEHVQGCVQVGACVAPSALAAKPLSVEEVGASQVRDGTGEPESGQRLLVLLLCLVRPGEQGLRPCK